LTVEIGTFNTTTTFDVTSNVTNFTELYISINGTIYDDTNFTWATTIITLTGGLTCADGDRLRAIFYLTTPDDDYTELDTTGIGAVKGAYSVIGLGDADVIDSSSKSVRVQSVDVNVTITREDVKELGTQDLVTSIQTKQEVTVDATVLEEDMENLARIMGASASDWANRDTSGLEWRMQDSIGNLQELFVKIYDDSAQTNLLKTLNIVDMNLLNNPFTQDVGALGQYTLSFKADNWEWVGNGDLGRLANSYPTGYPVNPDKGS
jgi:hypothetical protein